MKQNPIMFSEINMHPSEIRIKQLESQIYDLTHSACSQTNIDQNKTIDHNTNIDQNSESIAKLCCMYYNKA